MAMEWTISIEGKKNALGDICRQEVRLEKSDERLFDGDIGLSIGDGKKIMATLQSAVVNHEAETYALFSTGLPGLLHLSASQGLYDAPNSNGLRNS